MKKTAVTALKVAVSIGLFAYIFTKVDLAHIWDILKGADISYFVAGVLVYAAIQAISAYRWYLLLRPLGLRTSYLKLFSYYLLGMYFNFFLPTAIGGDVVRVYYLHKESGRLSRATASVFLDRDLGMAALLVMATVVATIAGTEINGVPLAPLFGMVGVAFALANMALFYRPTYNLLHRLLTLFKMKRVDERVEHLFQSVNAYRGRWSLLSGTMILSLLVQVGCVLVNVLSADAIGLETRNGWVDYLVFIPAIGLISMIPVSVNGMGWREFSYIMLFVSVGATEAQAAALAFLWLGVLVTTSLPGGVIYLLRGSRTRETIPTSGEILDEADGREEQFSTLSGQQREEEPVSTI